MWEKSVLSLFFVTALIMVSGCSTAGDSDVKTYDGSTFRVTYPGAWKMWDSYQLGQLSEENRAKMPEAIILSPNLDSSIETMSFSTYASVEGTPFRRDEADAQIKPVADRYGASFRYAEQTTIDGVTAYVYMESRGGGKLEYRHIVFKKGPFIYYIIGADSSPSIDTVLRSFAAKSSANPTSTSPSASGALSGDYTATFAWDGTLTEIVAYQVPASEKPTMLYRNFEAPLVMETSGSPATTRSAPYIGFLSMRAPDETVSYVKDSSGTVTLIDTQADAAMAAHIRSKAENNEVGIYREAGFAPGTYTVDYTFAVHPPIEYDDDAAHLNLLLMDSHMPYNHVQIRIPVSSVQSIYVTPSRLQVTKEGTMIVATGSLDQDEACGFEAIFGKETMSTLPGFPTQVSDIAERVAAAYPHQTPFQP